MSLDLLPAMGALSPEILVDPDDALRCLVGTSGNFDLAAERLDCTKEALIEALTQRPQQLAEKLRALSVVSMVQISYLAQLRMREAIIEMEPYEVSRTYTGIMEIVSKLTEASVKTNLNIHEYVVSNLPPEVREALALLGTTASEPTASEPNSDA